MRRKEDDEAERRRGEAGKEQKNWRGAKKL